MKYEHAVEIERLAGELFHKQERFNALAEQNRNSGDPEVSRKAFIACELARVEMYAADAALRKAQARAVEC